MWPAVTVLITVVSHCHHHVTNGRRAGQLGSNRPSTRRSSSWANSRLVLMSCSRLNSNCRCICTFVSTGAPKRWFSISVTLCPDPFAHVGLPLTMLELGWSFSYNIGRALLLSLQPCSILAFHGHPAHWVAWTPIHQNLSVRDDW